MCSRSNPQSNHQLIEVPMFFYVCIFMTGIILHSVDELSVLVSSLVLEDAVFKQTNINLSPEQKKTSSLALPIRSYQHQTCPIITPKKSVRENHILSSLVTTNVRIVNNLCVQFANMPSKNDVNHLKT